MTQQEEKAQLVRLVAEALAEAYTSPYGLRNPAWDWTSEDGPDNEYYLKKPMDSRVQEPTSITFTASDGHRSIRFASILEIAEVVASALHPEVTGPPRVDSAGT